MSFINFFVKKKMDADGMAQSLVALFGSPTAEALAIQKNLPKFASTDASRALLLRELMILKIFSTDFACYRFAPADVKRGVLLDKFYGQLESWLGSSSVKDPVFVAHLESYGLAVQASADADARIEAIGSAFAAHCGFPGEPELKLFASLAYGEQVQAVKQFFKDTVPVS